MYVRDIFGYDLPTIYEIHGQDTYRLKEISLPKRAVVLDVGAHIGSFSVAIHSKFPDAVITAFEPHPSNFRLLQENAPFARCIPKAVSGVAGKAFLTDHKASASYALSLSETDTPVDTVSLGDYLREVPRVDLMKVDIEGAEKDVFEHLEPELLSKVDRIMMEIHPPHAVAWFTERFKAAGFVVIAKNDLLFANRQKVQIT